MVEQPVLVLAVLVALFPFDDDDDENNNVEEEQTLSSSSSSPVLVAVAEGLLENNAPDEEINNIAPPPLRRYLDFDEGINDASIASFLLSFKASTHECGSGFAPTNFL